MEYLNTLDIGSAYTFRTNANNNFKAIDDTMASINTNICSNLYSNATTPEWTVSAQGATLAAKVMVTDKLHIANANELETQVTNNAFANGEFCFVLDDIIE